MKKSKLLLFLIAVCFCFAFISLGIKERLHPFKFPEIEHFPPMPLATSNMVTEEGVSLGRFLFYDPILSGKSDISCASCHRQSRAFSDEEKKFSKGANGKKSMRNTPPLFNLAWYKGLFWDGRSPTLENQVLHPVRTEHEMNATWRDVIQKLEKSEFYRKKFRKVFGGDRIDSSRVAMAIAQFERTLISHNSKYDQVIRKKAKLTLEEIEGLELVNDMNKGNCLHCHTTDADGLGTTGEFANNGLDEIRSGEDFKDAGYGIVTGKKEDKGKFKIPSLRNLAFTAPYMHDGRFQILEEVLDFYASGTHASATLDNRMQIPAKGKTNFSKEEKRKMILFLNTLNDYAFISDPAYGNPHIK
jgi:cytochrome c peroxidase